MTRLRATLALNPLDREIANHVDTAQRSILAAIRLCDVKAKDRDVKDEGGGEVSRTRIHRVREDLKRVMGAMGGVRRVASPYSIEDQAPVPKPIRESKAASKVAPAAIVEDTGDDS